MEKLLEFGAITFLFVSLMAWISATNHESFLDEICVGIQATNERRFRGSHFHYIAKFKFQERNCSLSFGYRLWQRTGRANEEFEIAIPVIQKFWLRLLPPTDAYHGSAKEPQMIVDVHGISLIGHSNQPDAATEFLNRPEMARHWKEIGPFQKLEIYRGVLRVIYLNPSACFTSESLQATLNALLQLLFFYEEQTSLRLIATAANELCPFCRGKLDGARESIFQCRECETRLHASCWRENGHCTTWGCASTTAAPANG
jgi:hypothetical protein